MVILVVHNQTRERTMTFDKILPGVGEHSNLDEKRAMRALLDDLRRKYEALDDEVNYIDTRWGYEDIISPKKAKLDELKIQIRLVKDAFNALFMKGIEI